VTALPIENDTPAAEARQARLSSAVAGIRSRSDGFDVERALHWAGSILFPTGIVIILLGWYGAAHTSYDFQQVPYLISGGILGAALTTVGGFLYFGYWISRLVAEGRRERVELAGLLTRLDNRLAAMEAMSANGAGRSAVSASAFVATATGTLVHRPGCSLIAGKPGLRAVIDPVGEGLKPCKVCEPYGEDGTPPEAAAPVRSRRSRPLRA
jgi:hypothetical protein